MDALAYDLKRLSFNDRTGARQTRCDRHRLLQSMARELKAAGYKLQHARSLKPKHIQHLVQTWQDNGLSAGGIKNRMSAVRWWARSVNKASVVSRDNEAYGIAPRKADDSNKAQRLDLGKVDALPCPRMQMAVRLSAAFGLRVEEALKFQPRLADKGDSITLKPSWTKGGRPRTVPVLTERHRALLDEAHQVAGQGSLIPPDKTYIKFRKEFQYQTLKAGLNNLHGLRHNYAQWRYQSLTGQKCPKAGGPARKDLKPAAQELDRDARLTIAEELGHGRIDVTKAYLG